MLKTILKTLLTITSIISALLLAWLFLSWLEIVSKNIYGGSTYNDYNIIVNTIRYFNGKF